MARLVLAELRRRAGLSQEELAEASEISVRTIRDIERGVVARPRRDSIQRIAQALRLSDAARAHFEGHYRGTPDPHWPTPITPPMPRELPRDIADFVGREAEVRRIEHALAPRGGNHPLPIAAIVGPGGFGKSTLAVHVAHRLAPAYPDGQLFLNLGGQRATRPARSQLVGVLLASLGVQPDAIPEPAAARVKLLRSLLAERAVLVVLDDAADAADLDDLLPGGPPCAVLVTSRSPLAELSTTARIALRPLTPPEAHEVLAIVTGRDLDRSAAADQLAELCGHAPLALRIIGARLAARPDWTLEHCVERLHDERSRLRELEYGSLNVAASLGVSYQALVDGHDPADRDAAYAFTRLALVPGADFPLETAAAALNQSSDIADITLSRLLAVGLIQVGREGRFGYHDLTRLYALSLLGDQPDERERVMVRIGDHYIDGLDQARRMGLVGGPGAEPERLPSPFFGTSDTGQLLRWLRAEHASFTSYALKRLSQPTPDIDRAYRIIVRLSYLAGGRQDLAMQISLAEAVCAATQNRPDATWYRAWAHRHLAERFLLAGDCPAAREHLAAALESGANDGEYDAQCEFIEATILGREGDYAGAVEGYHAILRRHAPLSPRHHAVILGNLSYALALQGRREAALNYRLRENRLTRRHGTVGDLALSEAYLAELLVDFGAINRAIEAGTEARDLARSLRRSRLEATAAHALAVALRSAGRWDEANELARHSLERAELIGDPFIHARSHVQLGHLAMLSGDTPASKAHWEQALRLFESHEPGRVEEVRHLLERLSAPAPLGS